MEQIRGAQVRLVPQLSGASFVFKDLLLKGDASFALRKQKRLLCYELSATFKWEGREGSDAVGPDVVLLILQNHWLLG
eukprot:Skav229621  [mRNA]  locus=scaffold1753:119885:124126:- [translate_table: standard]